MKEIKGVSEVVREEEREINLRKRICREIKSTVKEKKKNWGKIKE